MTRLLGYGQQHNQIGYALVTRGAGEDERATLNAPRLAGRWLRLAPPLVLCRMCAGAHEEKGQDLLLRSR